MGMQGHKLSALDQPLSHVASGDQAKPLGHIQVVDLLGPKIMEHYESMWGTESDEATIRNIDARVLTHKLTFDQLCQYKYGQFIMMDRSVTDMFDNQMPWVAVQKIENSMWRWGCGKDVWNEVVDAYNGLRDFTIPVDDFEVTLDFTTGCNERGYSREARVFLDGVFGLLVHYKGKHVMTLGFSFVAGGKLLIQQIQLTNHKGNRFLFKLPKNYIEFILEQFTQAFPNHTICLVDGLSVGEANLRNYREGIMRINDRITKYPTDSYHSEWLKERGELALKLHHLQGDLPRLDSLYANTGKFRRGEGIKVNGLMHYELTV